MPPALIVVGTSLGGLDALQVLLAGLPQHLAVPVAIVQHRGKEDDDLLQTALQRLSPLPVREVEDKDRIESGHIYLAPADYHLLVEAGHFALSVDAPVLYARPSIDVLFESAADAYGADVLAIVLTGASADGACGVARIKARGGVVLVQDPATAQSGIMPQAAMAAAPVDRVLPLQEMAAYVLAWSRKMT